MSLKHNFSMDQKKYKIRKRDIDVDYGRYLLNNKLFLYAENRVLFPIEHSFVALYENLNC